MTLWLNVCNYENTFQILFRKFIKLKLEICFLKHFIVLHHIFINIQIYFTMLLVNLFEKHILAVTADI